MTQNGEKFFLRTVLFIGEYYGTTLRRRYIKFFNESILLINDDSSLSQTETIFKMFIQNEIDGKKFMLFSKRLYSDEEILLMFKEFCDKEDAIERY